MGAGLAFVLDRNLEVSMRDRMLCFLAARPRSSSVSCSGGAPRIPGFKSAIVTITFQMVLRKQGHDASKITVPKHLITPV